jgi:hypothetical protein
MEDLRRRSGDSPWRPQRPDRRRGVGDWLLQGRQAAGVPQAVLARRLSISICRLSRLERGLDPIPARLIATVLGMLPADQSSHDHEEWITPTSRHGSLRPLTRR